jgi:hypothetical protein
MLGHSSQSVCVCVQIDQTFLSPFKTTTDAFTAAELVIITNNMSLLRWLAQSFHQTKQLEYNCCQSQVE